MNSPLVTIIITTFNRPDFLFRAINSVINQTYKNIEILIVNDCSTDSTEQIIDKYEDSRIKYIKNTKNIGLSASRNIGIELSSGDYLSFLDDDDVIFPHKVESQVCFLNNNESVDIVYCGHCEQYPTKLFDVIPKLEGNIFPMVLDGSPGVIHSLMFRAKCFRVIGMFDEELQHAEDFDLWIRMSKVYSFGLIRESLVSYTIHGEQMTTDYSRALIGRKALLYKHCEVFKQHYDYLYLHLMRQASKCVLNHDYRSFYEFILWAKKIKPFSGKIYVHLLLSFICRPVHKWLILTFGIKKQDGIIRSW